MRTTVTLDPEVERLVKRAMRERGRSFKEVVNEGLRAGLGGSAPGDPVDFPTYDLGEPLVDLTKALRLAGDLEDAEIAGELARGA